jgi:superoxide dismutase, Cu-Zn family
MRGIPRSDRPHHVWRRSTLVGIGAVLVLIPIGGVYRGPGTPTPAAWYDIVRPTVVFGSGTLTTPSSKSKAISYNPDLAPIGAAMTATVIPTSEGSMAELTVFGLLPNRAYVAYAYTKACGATVDAAGRRFQNHLDPAASIRAPSTNHEYANPENEIWLDVRTDAAGAGNSRTTVPFILSDRTPGSFVVHDAAPIPTEDQGQGGKVGGRVACLTLSRR